MSALLIIESLNPQAISLPGDLVPFVQSSWNRGDKRRRGVHDTSGHMLALSGANVDATNQQITDAVAFLSRHADLCSRYIEALISPRAELILAACIFPARAAAQEITLPTELVAAAGRLALSVSLRTYLTDESAA